MTSPIIAITLVLCAVFVPIAFITGLTGQFYRQFALTIAFSTIISAFNSLTLSPALAAILLKSHDAPKDWLTKGVDAVFGGFFRLFNRFFRRSSETYGRGVNATLKRKSLSIGVYVLLLGAAYFGFQQVPPGFVPVQDKQYLVSFAQLPDGATLDRTETVIRAMSDIALKEPGVESAVAFPGLSINGFINSASAGIVFVTLKPFDERKTADLSGFAISQKLQRKYAGLQDAFIAIFPPPPVQGLGTIGGFKLQVEDRTDLGYAALDAAMKQVVAKARRAPELAGIFTSYEINVPQLYADLDRTKALQLGVDVQDVFAAMQIYLGSLYVNDFNRFGRTYQVIAQADKAFRSKPDDILRLQTRNFEGRMVPLGAMIRVSDTTGPESAMRYNAFRSADLNGGPAPGFSSGQAQQAITRILRETLPKGMAFEWTELTFQQEIAGNTAMIVFPICVLLVFLVLAAKYESLFLPLAVILIVPMCLLSAITGVWISGGDNNIFTQISLFVLAGLACKNAILIVEFARESELHGNSTIAAAIEAARLRLRPILMTSFAFIMGVVPLVVSTGAGAEMRHAMGIAVFAGMLGVTFFGLFLTPVFYVLLRGIEKRVKGRPAIAQRAKMLAPVTALSLLVVMLLGGCSTDPVGPQASGIDVPNAWTRLWSKPEVPAGDVPLASSGTAEIEQLWWRSFDDAALDRLIDGALANNKTLKIAQARVEEARANRRGAVANLWPEISATGSVSRANQGVLTNNKAISIQEADLQASWEVDLFGKNQARTAEAAAILQSEDARRQAVMVSLLAEVARGYFDLRNYEAQIAITKKNLVTQQADPGSHQGANGRCAQQRPRCRAGGRPGLDHLGTAAGAALRLRNHAQPPQRPGRLSAGHQGFMARAERPAEAAGADGAGRGARQGAGQPARCPHGRTDICRQPLGVRCRGQGDLSDDLAHRLVRGSELEPVQRRDALEHRRGAGAAGAQFRAGSSRRSTSPMRARSRPS